MSCYYQTDWQEFCTDSKLTGNWLAGKLSADEMDDMLNNMRLAAPEADGVLVQLLTRWAATGRSQTKSSAQPASEPSQGAAVGTRSESPPLPGSPSVLEASERPAKRARWHSPMAPQGSVSEDMVRVFFILAALPTVRPGLFCRLLQAAPLQIRRLLRRRRSMWRRAHT